MTLIEKQLKLLDSNEVFILPLEIVIREHDGNACIKEPEVGNIMHQSYLYKVMSILIIFFLKSINPSELKQISQ